MTELIEKTEQLISKYPKLKKRLNEYLVALKNFENLQDEYFIFYSKLILKKYELLINAFDVSLSGSINLKELVSIEIKDIDAFLTEGKAFADLTISAYSSIIELNSTIPVLYKKLIKGLEIELLHQAADKESSEIFKDLSTIRALLLFKEYLLVLGNTTPQQTETKASPQPMRIKENPFETHYLLTIEGYFLTMFLQGNTDLSETTFWNCINDISTIIEQLPQAQKVFFIEQLKAQTQTEMRFKQNRDFQMYFEPFFNRYIDFLNSLQTSPYKAVEAETGRGTPTFTNNFDKIKPNEIYKHFKAGLVEKGYLTERELNEYLKAAFELKKIPEVLFKIKDAPNKAAIEAVFYTYYKNVAGKIHGKQNQYAALLGAYFEGYKTATVSSNFSKSVY